MNKSNRTYESPRLNMLALESEDVMNTSDEYGRIAYQFGSGNDDAWDVSQG